MRRLYSFVCALLLAATLISAASAAAETEITAPPLPQDVGAAIEAELKEAKEAAEAGKTDADPEDLDFLDGLDSLLDPDDNSLEQKANEILDKYSDNPIVRFFQKLIDAIKSFLEKLFALATEAITIEVT